MQEKRVFNKLTVFWLMPLISGVFFSTAYVLTSRKLEFDGNTSKATNNRIESTTNSAQQKKEAAKSSVKETSSKQKVNIQETIINNFSPQKQIIQRSHKDGLSFKSEKSKYIHDQPIKQDSALGDSENPARKVVVSENESFVEDLFKTLPDP